MTAAVAERTDISHLDFAAVPCNGKWLLPNGQPVQCANLATHLGDTHSNVNHETALDDPICGTCIARCELYGFTAEHVACSCGQTPLLWNVRPL